MATATGTAAERRGRVLEILGDGVVSARRLGDEGIPRYLLARMAEDGLIERVGRGYYGAVGRPDLGASRAAAVGDGLALRRGIVPVLCLATAAVVHRLTTDNKVAAVWVAIPRDSAPPTRVAAGLPVRVVKMRPELLLADVEPVEFGGREVMVTTRERTIVDMLRMSKVRRDDGLPVVPLGEGVGCLEKGLSDGADPGEIVRIAEGIPRARWIASEVALAVARTAPRPGA